MFAFAALVALPLVAQSALAKDCTRTYTVQAGDICDSISAAHNVSTYQLAVVNPKIDSQCSNLTPGDTLCLGYAGEDCNQTYIVRKDDTCDLISQRTGVNSTLLWANNPQINNECTNIYIGEVLCTGNTYAAPPPPASIPAVTPPVTATPAVTSSTTVPVTTAAPAVTSSTIAPALTSSTVTPVTSAPALAATPTPTPDDDNDDNNDDDDDDDLPYCDEL